EGRPGADLPPRGARVGGRPMYSRLRIVGWYLAACLAATAAAVAAAAPAGPAARAGGRSPSGCPNRQGKGKVGHECHHVLQGTAPCATTVCIENELRWAACDEKKPPHDKGECKMKVKGDEPRWLQRPIESKTGLTCTDNDWEPVGDRVPKDGKCQSPGIT